MCCSLLPLLFWLLHVRGKWQITFEVCVCVCVFSHPCLSRTCLSDIEKVANVLEFIVQALLQNGLEAFAQNKSDGWRDHEAQQAVLQNGLEAFGHKKSDGRTDQEALNKCFC